MIDRIDTTMPPPASRSADPPTRAGGGAIRWRALAGRLCLALAALIFTMAVLAWALQLSEGGGAEALLAMLAFGFLIAVPLLLAAQQTVFRPGQSRACLQAGRVLGLGWLAADAWLLGLYL